mgnify:CR=1 FL=1|jgi:hypothetical protein
MRISNINDIRGVELHYIVEDAFKQFVVSYNTNDEKVLCETCMRTRCAHVAFVSRFLTSNEAWKINDFIFDCCEVRMTFFQIGLMRNAFKTAIETTEKTPIMTGLETLKPKDPPTPFSLIELD